MGGGLARANPHLPALAGGWPDGGGGRLQGSPGPPLTPEPQSLYQMPLKLPLPTPKKPSWSQQQHQPLGGQASPCPHPPSGSLSHPFGHKALFLYCIQIASNYLPFLKLTLWGLNWDFGLRKPCYLSDFKQAPFSVWATISSSVKWHCCCAPRPPTWFSTIVRVQGLWVFVLHQRTSEL